MEKDSNPEERFGEFAKFGSRRVLTRREFLTDGAVTAAGAAGLSMFGQLTVGGIKRVAAAQPRSAKDTIVVGWHSEPQSLDPLKQFDLGYAVQVSETMVRLAGGSAEIKPSLATSWQVSKDGKEWTFKIRQGVRFHDGTLMKTKDIEWTFDRWLDPKHPFYDPPYGLVKYFFGALEKVEAVDDRTVKFFLSRVDPAFDATMLFPYTNVVSPTALKKVGLKNFGLKPVFTGPWRVREWIKGTRRVFERFDQHWGHRPILRRLITKPIPEAALRLAQLQRGEVDVIEEVPPQFIPVIESNPNLRLLRKDGNHLWWVALNVREKPLSDKRVRQALNYAINKEAIVRDLLKGGAKIAAGPVMVGSWAEDTTLRPYPHDPNKAKELLVAAGYGDGFRTRFWVPLGGSGMVAPQEIATVMQSQLREVGVIAEIVTQEWTSYLEQWGGEGFSPKGKPSFGMAEMSWNTPLPDPSFWMVVNLGTDGIPPKGFNGGYHSNPEVDRLLKQAGSTLDRQERKRLYVQVQRIIYDEAPWIFMFSAQNFMATRKEIQGLEVNPCPWWFDFTTTYVQG